jgi:undecaprenyl diphosphate synthase
MTDRIIPKHIGFVVDGNRRWAKQHGIPVYEGHLAGYNAIVEVVLAAIDSGVEFVSAYTFSTENWKRSEAEVSNIMGLVIRLLTADLHILQDNDIRLIVLGTRVGLGKKVIKAIDEAESKTANNKRGTLAVCFNYGGQLEIVDAMKEIMREGVNPEDVTEDMISKHLYVPEVPPLDIVVRTSGEQRLSNFMLWRAAYSELLFLDKLWPDMTKEDVTAILEEYSRRNRRFGG